MAKIGEIIDGKYEILKEVGRGGMSVVYLAMDNRLNKQWAIKEIKKKGTNAENQVVVQSLLTEANLMKKLDHPNLPRIVDIIETGKTIYIAMDYIEGEPLDKILKMKGAQPQDAVIEWGIHLAEVLEYLHTRKPPIIYRDMKPANVMLRPDGTIKLYDFGIAREYKEQNSSDTVSLGTKGYAAPEQFGGMGQTDARTDVYGLGVTLYHLVTGKNPCEPPYEILPIRDVNSQLSSGLEAVIQKCTQLNPDERFQSCVEVLYALNHLDEMDGRYRKKQKSKLNGFIVSTVATLVLALAGTGSLIGYKMTLSQTIQETIAQYGSESASGGNLDELFAALEKYDSDINEESRYELIVNYLDTLGATLSDLVENAYSENVIQQNEQLGNGTDVAGENVSVTYEDKLFVGLDAVVDKFVVHLNEEHKNEIYYRAGNFYLNYYQINHGKNDDKYIKIRIEEASQRFKNITDNYDPKSLGFVKRIEKIGDVIKFFDNATNGLSDYDSSIQDEKLIEQWKNLYDVANEENSEKVFIFTNMINTYLVIGNILYEHRVEYAETKNINIINEIYQFSSNAANTLSNVKGSDDYKKVSDNKSITQKIDKALVYYQSISDFLSAALERGE